MRVFSWLLGLAGLLTVPMAQAASYVFSATVNSSTLQVATLDISQTGTDTLFQLAPGADFASLGSGSHIASFTFGYDTPSKLRSGFIFPATLPSNNVRPSSYNFANYWNRSAKDYVNMWSLSWKKPSFGNTQTSTWITRNSEASLFGSTFYLKIQGLTGVNKPLVLTALNAAPVPEVSNFGMYVTGLGLVGLVMLRRRHGTRAASR